jgi:CheY-like chemotaxis protein
MFSVQKQTSHMPQQLLLTRFSLERSSGASSFSKASPSSGSSTSLKKTVMICEDDPDLLRVYELALRSKYNVIPVSSGKECLRKYSEMMSNGREVEGLLLDYRLGDMTGDQVATKVKELDGTKVILISAFEIDYELAKALKSDGSIVMMVKKPVTIRELTMALETVLNQ